MIDIAISSYDYSNATLTPEALVLLYFNIQGVILGSRHLWLQQRKGRGKRGTRLTPDLAKCVASQKMIPSLTLGKNMKPKLGSRGLSQGRSGRHLVSAYPPPTLAPYRLVICLLCPFAWMVAISLSMPDTFTRHTEFKGGPLQFTAYV